MKETNTIESKFLQLIIPHQENLNWITNVVDDLEGNQDKVFIRDKYKFREKDLTLNSVDLKENIINDHLQDEQYWIPIETMNTNHKIWHWLSVFVGNYNIPNLRNHLTSQIYENPNFDGNLDNLSGLFEQTDYLIYQVEYNSEKSIGILKKSSYKEFVQLAKQLNMNVVELKKD